MSHAQQIRQLFQNPESRTPTPEQRIETLETEHKLIEHRVKHLESLVQVLHKVIFGNGQELAKGVLEVLQSNQTH